MSQGFGVSREPEGLVFIPFEHHLYVCLLLSRGCILWEERGQKELL